MDMGNYWICKQHGKNTFTIVCVHLKQSVESGNIMEFNLVREEISKTHNIYLGALICNECSNRIGAPNKITIFFSPQLRQYDQNDDLDIDEDDIQYEDIYSNLNEKLTSVCNSCFLNVYPNYQSVEDIYSKNPIEIEKTVAQHGCPKRDT